MNAMMKKISATWPFVFGIAVGIGLTSFVLLATVVSTTDYLCQLDFEQCAKNPLADCVYECATKRIDPSSLLWLLLASLPVFLIALILGIMHRDAKRS